MATFGTDEITWKTFDRCVTIKTDRVIKRELGEQELKRVNGQILRPYWAKERLRNEAATLEFIKENTTIPVPAFRLYTDDGILHLETKRISGISLLDVAEEFREAAAEAVDQEIISSILPQLRLLRRNVIGSVDRNLPIFPPQRVYVRDRREWARISSQANEFCLCHNDLGAQNILINPKTFKIVGLIDWEFAGFFPSYFELPLWKAFDNEQRQAIYGDSKRELEFFGLTEEDLKDCLFSETKVA